MTIRSANRVAIVTGARPWGVGGATARALAQRGYDIALVDLRQDWGEQSAEAIREETGQRAIWVRADVSNRDDVAEMADSVLGEFGRIDALVNNAAVGLKTWLTDFNRGGYDGPPVVGGGVSGQIYRCFPHVGVEGRTADPERE